MRQGFTFAFLGVLSPGINYALAVGGLSRTSASAAALISAVDPIAVVLLSLAFLRERLDLRGALLVAVSFAGLVLVADPFAGNASVTWGSVMVALGVLAAALYVVLLQRVEDVDPVAAVAVQFVAGAITLVAIALIANGSGTLSALARLPAPYLVATIAAGPLLDYLPFLLLTYASKHLSGTTVGVAFNLSPLWAVAIATVFLSERLDVAQVAGGVLVLVSTFAF
jgi:drug/metabolite transporter (DMT)-like permease